MPECLSIMGQSRLFDKPFFIGVALAKKIGVSALER